MALGFTFEACSYHLKVIRDRPTAAYKWGAFPGVNAVIEKYRVVHEINRAGSMLDNVMYFNLRLDRELFEPELSEELLQEAPGSVQVAGRGRVHALAHRAAEDHSVAGLSRELPMRPRHGP